MKRIRESESPTSDGASLLVTAFRDAAATANWSIPRWQTLVHQARRADVLATLAERLSSFGTLDRVPAAARAHLHGARILASAQSRDMRREVVHVTSALESLDVSPVLLKGGAYLVTALPCATGRVFSDLDILVPRRALAQVEAMLMMHGWMTTHHEPYDQRYYRDWMHELPPMRHIVRQTVLDVHHAILPVTSRFTLDPSLLLERAQTIDGVPGMRVLAPVDMVLHSATHLLCNEEFSHGFRDLLDLDSLMRHFSATYEEFWVDLANRAEQLGLSRLLHYAIRYAQMLLDTPVPREILQRMNAHRPPGLARLMDALFSRALDVDHPTVEHSFGRAARRMLYVRGHWLKMPAHLLVYHLTVKAFRERAQESPA